LKGDAQKKHPGSVPNARSRSPNTRCAREVSVSDDFAAEWSALICKLHASIGRAFVAERDLKSADQPIAFHSRKFVSPADRVLSPHSELQISATKSSGEMANVMTFRDLVHFAILHEV
jgi:hypothetical protein